MKRLSPEEKSQIISDYDSGKNVKAILKKFDIGNTTLFRILKANNIEKRLKHLPTVAEKQCKQCGKIKKMKSGLSVRQFLSSSFCSRRCFADYNRGKHRGIHPKSEFKKGLIPWNKGKDWVEMKGTNHPNFKLKVVKNCATCGKKLNLHPYRLKSKNNYCSSACTVQGQYDTGVHQKQETKPVLIIQNCLETLGYIKNADFFREYRIGKNASRFDFAFPKQKVLIEVHGDYFHANPMKYIIEYHNGILITKQMRPNDKEKRPNNIQAKNRKRDEAKRKLAIENGWRYLFYWESEIKDPHNINVIVNSIIYSMNLDKPQ